MFINTLCIGTWTLHNWAIHKADVRPTKPDKSINKKDAMKKKGLQQFFSLLSKMESHYCRASSSKLYLETIWQSKSVFYKEYAKYCKDSDLQILSVKVFYEELDNNNLSLFHPKKDQRDLCIRYKRGNTSEEAYTSHIQSKIRA